MAQASKSSVGHKKLILLAIVIIVILAIIILVLTFVAPDIIPRPETAGVTVPVIEIPGAEQVAPSSPFENVEEQANPFDIINPFAYGNPFE